MSVRDLRCDFCGRWLTGVASPGRDDAGAGIRFTYHPGDPRMRDDSGTACASCWTDWEAEFGPARPGVCADCGVELTRRSSLHLRRYDVAGPPWQFCREHAAYRLNFLLTVDPKLDPDEFRLPLDRAVPDVGD